MEMRQKESLSIRFSDENCGHLPFGRPILGVAVLLLNIS